MAWTNLTFSFGAILTSSQMTQLDDNLDALAAGSAGAPKVLDAALNSTFVKTTGNENIAGIKTFTENVGIGVSALESWGSAWSALQLGGNASLSGVTSPGSGKEFNFVQNAYVDDSNWRYQDTDEASRYSAVSGKHIFLVTPSGAADSVISWTTALTINNDGSITLGTDLAVSEGGTGASTASGARTNLGLGAVAVLDEVDQGALKTTTGEISVTSTTFVNVTLPGGGYGFYPQVKNSTSLNTNEMRIQISERDGTNPPTSFIANICMANEGAATCTAQQRYIQASPPYNLGDGDIPLFMFLVIDNITGDIVSTYIAEDPPWANNGPTNIRPDRVAKDGKKYQNQILLPDGSRVSQGSPGFNALIKSKLGVQAIRDQWIDALRNPTITEIEITQDIKQADMGIIPHPFGSPQPGKTIVLLDPVGSVVDDLYLLKNQGANITDIVMNHITLGNTSNGANSPPGVMSVSAAWKNTS